MYNGVVTDERPGQSTRDEVTLRAWTSSYCHFKIGTDTRLVVTVYRTGASTVLLRSDPLCLLFMSTSLVITIVLVVQRYRYVPHNISNCEILEYSTPWYYSTPSSSTCATSALASNQRCE